MAFIDKKPNGKYQVRWRDPDGRARAVTAPDHQTAKAIERDVERTVAQGFRWEPRDAVVLPDLTDVFEKYITHRSKRLRAVTLRRYAENLELFKRFLRSEHPRGPLPVSLLTKPLLEDFHSWLLVPANGLHGRQRSADTARKIVEVAQLAWVWADESDRWPGQIPRPRSIEMERSEPEPVVAPTWAEMDRCVEAATGWLAQLMTVLRYTGLRVGETMLLRWTDVDLDRATLTLRSETSKNRKGRIIPVSEHLVDVLAGWGVREGWLIPSTRREGERERQARQRDAARAWSRAGVRASVWDHEPFHAFRNGFKTNLLALGAHPDAVDHLQGHKLGRGSRDRYIDPWLALPLVDTVAKVPAIGEVKDKVVGMARKGAAR